MDEILYGVSVEFFNILGCGLVGEDGGTSDPSYPTIVFSYGRLDGITEQKNIERERGLRVGVWEERR